MGFSPYPVHALSVLYEFVCFSVCLQTASTAVLSLDGSSDIGVCVGLRRVIIRPGFPGHVLFFGFCPAGCPGFWPNPQVHSNVANCKGVRRHETKKAG